MTDNKDFKKLVRERSTKTGESYSSARMNLLAQNPGTAVTTKTKVVPLPLHPEPHRWDETWHRLREWTNGPGPSERLAAQILHHDGYEDLDPSHPLGGPDGGKDALCRKDGKTWVMAVFFPRGQERQGAIRKKLLGDLAGISSNRAHGLAFVTNQELSLRERDALKAAAGAVPVELYHLERITMLLDTPGMSGVRKQFLQIDDALSGNTEAQRGEPVPDRICLDLIAPRAGTTKPGKREKYRHLRVTANHLNPRSSGVEVRLYRVVEQRGEGSRCVWEEESGRRMRWRDETEPGATDEEQCDLARVSIHDDGHLSSEILVANEAADLPDLKAGTTYRLTLKAIGRFAGRQIESNELTLDVRWSGTWHADNVEFAAHHLVVHSVSPVPEKLPTKDVPSDTPAPHDEEARRLAQLQLAELEARFKIFPKLEPAGFTWSGGVGVLAFRLKNETPNLFRAVSAVCRWRADHDALYGWAVRNHVRLLRDPAPYEQQIALDPSVVHLGTPVMFSFQTTSRDLQERVRRAVRGIVDGVLAADVPVLDLVRGEVEVKCEAVVGSTVELVRFVVVWGK